jgi:hypothetical protein
MTYPAPPGGLPAGGGGPEGTPGGPLSDHPVGAAMAEPAKASKAIEVNLMFADKL